VVELRELAQRLEDSPTLPAGEEERFSGYGVMSCPFSSGDILCHRRFTKSSVGPAYTAIWHYSGGRWTFYQDTPPEQACTRYFSSAVDDMVRAPITTEWLGDRKLRLAIEGTLEWEMSFASTPVTRVMNGIGKMMPDALWRNGAVLTMMSAVAGIALGAGKLALAGTMPNRQHYIANPMIIWRIAEARASVDGRDLGTVSVAKEQAKLGDFWIPRTGLMVIGRAFFDVYDPAAHVLPAPS
jgi:hypothetical protein